MLKKINPKAHPTKMLGFFVGNFFSLAGKLSKLEWVSLGEFEPKSQREPFFLQNVTNGVQTSVGNFMAFFVNRD